MQRRRSGVKLAARGKRVALVERRHLGGSCVNFGCTPTKSVVTSAHVAHTARRAGEFGVRVGEVTVDYAAVLARGRHIAGQARQSIERRYAESDAEVVRGHARLAGRDGDRTLVTVTPTGDDGGPTGGPVRTLRAPAVVLDPGTRSLVPDIEGVGDIDYMHAGNWLRDRPLPKRLVMVGGGYIGLEGGQFMQRCGSAVTVVEKGDQVASKEDAEIATALRECLEGEGITFRLNAGVTRVERRGDALRVHLSDGDPIDADQIYLAVGRRPNTDDLGLDTVNIEPSEKGVIDVDDRLRTGVPGVWAAGDVRGGPQFTHTAHADHYVLFDQLCGTPKSALTTTDRIVPWAIFTDPPLGRVGLTEAEARDAGHDVRVATMPAAKSDRHHQSGETAGLVKLVVEAGSERVLGASCLCHAGPEIAHLFVLMMNAGLPASALRDLMLIHPTFGEIARSVAFKVAPDGPDACGE